MASHRKPRSRSRITGGLRTTPAVGITTAALTSVALLSQTAQAAPAQPSSKPRLEEVQQKVDTLYRQAEVATQKYNGVKERTDSKKQQVDKLLDDVAQRTDDMNTARQKLGRYAAEQYRSGAVSDTATMFLADDPEDYFSQRQLMSRLTDEQKKSVDDYQAQARETAKKRTEAQSSLQDLTESQTELRSTKETVQTKLSDARKLLADLTAKEKARLAAIQKAKEEAARKKAAELAAKQKAAEAKRKAAEEAAQKEQESSGSSGSGSSGSSGSGSSSSDASYATKAAQALAFAKSQEGKPYVWGATGPDSYDCSGLTQAAWKSAGISLPRTTWDQVEVGKTVPLSDIQPGDLVFFYDDISHVGLYMGDGMMVHAPKPGAVVREESIYYDGTSSIHSVVRPA
ncbi:NlpC/P60 family protein [Streptomyces sp. NBC_00006]|uniref:C40 family peptidase n=1 Tax=unclassified Streptomyces TaxID=2593676 RepID=UPI0022584A66|nr:MULTISPECIES: C40 family peptidase [unclassified Streptomyces]MCX5531783.1 NlpC/P60 family protein [Streptomyces sp. NBC_00006]